MLRSPGSRNDQAIGRGARETSDRMLAETEMVRSPISASVRGDQKQRDFGSADSYDGRPRASRLRRCALV